MDNQCQRKFKDLPTVEDNPVLRTEPKVHNTDQASTSIHKNEPPQGLRIVASRNWARIGKNILTIGMDIKIINIPKK